MDHEVPPFSQTDRSGCQPGARPGSAQARPRLGPGSAQAGPSSPRRWDRLAQPVGGGRGTRRQRAGGPVAAPWAQSAPGAAASDGPAAVSPRPSAALVGGPPGCPDLGTRQEGIRPTWAVGGGGRGRAHGLLWSRGLTPVMNLDDIQLPLLLNSLGSLGVGRDERRQPGGPCDSVSEWPRQPARAPPARPRQGSGPPGPPPEPLQAEQQPGRCSACPELGGLGTAPASELICLQTPSPCQRQ